MRLFGKKKEKPFKPLLITITSVEKYASTLVNISIHCFICDANFTLRMTSDYYGTVSDTMTIRCPCCGAGGTAGEVKALMRREKEEQLALEQARARVARLEELRALEEREKLLQQGKTRVVEA